MGRFPAAVFAFLAGPVAAAPELVQTSLLRDYAPTAVQAPAPWPGAFSECGDLAVLVGLGTFPIPASLELHVRPAAGAAPEPVVIPVPFLHSGATVVYDASCTALVLMLETERYSLLRLEGAGLVPVAEGPVPRGGPETAGLNLLGGFRGADGRVRFLVEELGFENGTLVQVRHCGTVDGTTVHWVTLPGVQSGTVLDMTATAEGSLLLLRSVSGSFEFARDLVLDRYPGGSETVRRATERDWFPSGASLALRPDGSPVIAAQVVKTVTTGSPVYHRLMVCEPLSGGGWSAETLVTSSAGYQGTDGNGYTGARPRVVVDRNGGVHVSFHDNAIWHDGGFARGTVGQWRVLQRRAGLPWRTTLLVAQPGMTQSRNPLHALAPLGARVSAGGGRLELVGVRTESTQPPGNPSAAYSRVALTRWVAAEPGTAEPPVAPEVIAGQLCRRRDIPPPTNALLERNGDAVLDGADALAAVREYGAGR